MSVFSLLVGQRRSLKRGLMLNIITALSLCILMAGAVLIKEFYEHLEERLEAAMLDEAIEVIGQIDPSAPTFGLDANALRFQGVEGIYRYTVYNETGSVVAGGESSDAIWRQLSQAPLGEPQLIALLGDRLGVGLRARISDQDVYVLVSTYPKGHNETQFDKLMHEIKEEFWWAILGIVMILTSALLATRRALSLLEVLSDEAHQIGPAQENRRLSTDQMPVELVPLIANLNKAFDRLEQGYKAQRDFASNVAHEIRTPLAVLRSSIDRIEDPALKRTLSQDAKQLDRIFDQLIHLSRADAALQSGFEAVDLRNVAFEVASDLAPAALRSGRRLSVIGEETVIVNGNAGLLGIALANIVRNALQFTTENSEVEIELIADPAGWRILDRGPGVPDAFKTALFERFHRGNQANTGSQGSGIGLAVVKSVAHSHNAAVSIQDRDGGGSIFSFTFEQDL